MSESNRPTLRIDWFDESVIEDPQPVSSQNFSVSPIETVENDSKPRYPERKLMGFTRLLNISQQEPSSIILQLSGRSSFWDLLDSELKNDYIVLIVKIIAKLYISLQLGQKSFTLVNLLKNKFVPSKFIDTLLDYLYGLPSVKTVEKRFNMMFWDDPESTYSNIVDICKGIHSLSMEEINILHILDSVESSISGVIQEHKERFSEDIFNNISSLRQTAHEGNLNKPSVIKSDICPTLSFSSLNIFPTKQDLKSNTIDIAPNIIDGAYSSTEHYLDIQFKLLREDYFGPLREGISNYLENPMKRRHENIRVHPKVRFIRTYVTNNQVGYLVDIAWTNRQKLSTIDCKKYSHAKQLMFGSLLLFTCDNFETILCATVLDSNLSLLSDGYIAVSFQTTVSNSIFSEAFLMVESEVFFEPYHRVLKVLQSYSGQELPMSKYIVHVKPDTKPPDYLSPETVYALQQDDGSEISFSVLDTEKYPNCYDLDKSQFEAYKFSLTREFAVIQGPPGTGKSFIGIKVATTLLNNLSLKGTPMLIICYTNHALDQFLEELLNVTDKIIRLGSQSKSEKLEAYNLNSYRAKFKSKYGYLYAEKSKRIKDLYKEMLEIQDDIEKCDNEILDFDSIKSELETVANNCELLNNTNEDPVLSWLFDFDVKAVKNNEKAVQNDERAVKKDEKALDDWEKEYDSNNLKEIAIRSCFSKKWALKEIELLKNSTKYVKNIEKTESFVDHFKNQIEKIECRLREFKMFLELNKSNKLNKEINKVTDLYKLCKEERWTLYFKAIQIVKEKLFQNMDKLKLNHQSCMLELDDISVLLDGEVLSGARVVGVTTTAAARNHSLLHQIRSPIVIIEEAAEVFESHIVASVTHHCRHLVLIGDHRQLKPTAAHYKLAKHYNMEISLFERMIRNGIHARTLTTQRRMRPVFVDLIVPTIYDELHNHPKVVGYLPVRGIAKDLFFLTHSFYEDGDTEDGWSHKNLFEARWCVSLANYLIKQHYSSDDITILTTYNGQASLIRELSKKYDSLSKCRITVVDNYQGEESRIVILSLVRSNREGKIGFLSAQNRICVALSRAKEGFYIFGNMDVLKSASTIWKSINETLQKHNAIGDTLPVSCNLHPENIMKINSAEELDNCQKELCLKNCQNI